VSGNAIRSSPFGLPTPTQNLTIAQDNGHAIARSCSPAAREVHTKAQCVSHQHFRPDRVRLTTDVFERVTASMYLKRTEYLSPDARRGRRGGKMKWRAGNQSTRSDRR